MEKVMTLLWRRPQWRGDALRDALLGQLAELVRAPGVLGASLHVVDSDVTAPPTSRGLTGRAPFDAVVSCWLDDHTQRAVLNEVLLACGRRCASYLVTESLYTDYGQNRHASARDWPDSERSPAQVTVTLLEKPERFDYERWLAHWYGTQSPVSEAMQPRARYVRNAVVTCLDRHAPQYFGIVEEAWPSAAHITDPFAFYGAVNAEGLAQNMGAMLRSVTGFLDLSRIQNVTLSEYLVRTPEPPRV